MAHVEHGATGFQSEEVHFQYDNLDQQQESYVVGMWAFLVQEIMFFGGLFLMYTIYRTKYQSDWHLYHEQLDWFMGGINTTILLGSSFAAAMAVHFAQKKNVKMQLAMLGLVIVCAFGFLGVKTVEYGQKFEHHLFPNWSFVYSATNPEPKGTFTQIGTSIDKLVGREAGPEQGNPEKARLFFSLYFAMTGLHGLHVIIGIVVFGILMWMTWRKSPQITDYIPTELVCLYWHFVDLVWIFLYPLFYLIPK